MKLLRREITGPAKSILIGMLAGLATGAVAGRLYADEIIRRHVTDGNYSIKDRLCVDVKIKRDWVTFGSFAGAWLGIVCGASISSTPRRSETATKAV